jgi:hypothetical protein
MPTKNFFLSSSLTPTHSSHYLFLYNTRKRPMSTYMTGMLLNCNHGPFGPVTGTSLNCTSQDSHPVSGTTLNCNPSWPSTGMLFNCRHWTYSGSRPYIILGHLGHCSHLGHLGHLGHLSYLSTNGNLNTLNLYPLDLTPTDSPLEAFITEVDPMDPCPSEGYYEDSSLNPLPTATPLLLTRHKT